MSPCAAAAPRFGGERFDPASRGRGRNWMQWKKAALGGKH
jgi:hypothetical protein